MGSDVCLVAGVFIWEPFVRFLANPSWHARHTPIHNFWSYLDSSNYQSLAGIPGLSAIAGTHDRQTAGIVESAKALAAAEPGDDSNSILESALCLQMLQDLLAKRADLKPLSNRTRELWDTSDLLIHLLDTGGAPAAFIKQLMALAEKRRQSYPEWPSVEDWAFARHLDPVLATKLSTAMTKDQVGALTSKLYLRLAPHGSSVVLEQYRRELAAGKEQQAKQTYAAAIKRGIPFPQLKN